VNQPRSLMLFLDGAARGYGASAAFNRATVHANVFNCAKIEFSAGVAITVLINMGLFDGKQGNLCHDGLSRTKLRKYYTLGSSMRPSPAMTVAC
jgi:hypothetical protein